MEIREFAERVLFGGRLTEDKLLPVARVADLSDLNPGLALGYTPDAPGRPALMSIDDARPRVPFPSLSELERARPRGRVMHFFANHELLALELMALALLKFPDAPASFRRGLVGTMLEEQAHLRLYLQQMALAGVAPGEIPVNRYFWDCIASMGSPLDLVVRMSMTFEQANLDYAAFFARSFETIGDQDTAEVLVQVFEDEIGHVRHGLTWFERWRDPDESLFDAYCRLLPHPLTARRAKGRVFDFGARVRAGLPESYIRRLEVFGASRGRPPAVHWFNPDCEAEIALGPGWTPKANLHALATELELLPAFLAKSDDVLLVRRRPSLDFQATLHAAGLELPELHTLPTQGPLQLSQHAHVSALKPWGWSPAAQRLLEPLKPRLQDAQPSADWGPWREARRALYTKSWSALRLRECCERADWPDWWISPDAVGVSVDTLEGALRRCRELLAVGHSVAVIKAPWGASGRGAIRVRKGTLEAGQEGWLTRTLRTQGHLVVEPWLDKVVDLSLQLQLTPGEHPRELGLTRFLTDARGQYQGTLLAHPTASGLSPQLHRWMHDGGRQRRRLTRAASEVGAWVGQRLIAEGYAGPVGIDMMIVRRDVAGRERFAFKPIVEVNPRHTMGRVALAMRRRCAHGRVGFWGIWPVRALQRLGFEDATSFVDQALEHHPLETIREQGALRWRAGLLPTNDPAQARQVLSMALIGPSLADCRATLNALKLPTPL